MSKSIVKKALEILDDDNEKSSIKTRTKFNTIKKKKPSHISTIIEDRKQLTRTCLQLKKLSKPVVTSEQIEQINNYRFGESSKCNSSIMKNKKKEEENIFTEEDFQRFQREYNPPLKKS